MLTAVIGTGTWGTAAAMLVARGGHRTVLWGRDPLKTAGMAASRQHPRLSGHALSDLVEPTSDPQALAAADLVLWAVPTQHTRAVAKTLVGHLAASIPVVSLSKGLEEGSLKRVTTVLADELGDRPYACLSGPAMAPELVAGHPAALVAAGDERACRLLVERLHGPRLRIYTSPDLIGVELAGALKNVVAVAAGLCEGMGLGDNAKAALITRGLAEIRRLGRALGASDGTFAGLAGIGDLLTTCYSPHGRNRALGLALAAGHNPQDILGKTSTVAEGAWTSRAAVALGKTLGVELPIAFQVESVIWGATPVATALDNLLARAPKEEDA